MGLTRVEGTVKEEEDVARRKGIESM